MSTVDDYAERPTLMPPSIISLPSHHDHRGRLVYANPPDGIPFIPRHYFTLSELTVGVARGAHAHRATTQVLHCVHGSCTVHTTAHTGVAQTFTLDTPTQLLHSPPMTWLDLLPTQPHTVVVVMSDRPYAAADYIRDHAVFLAALADQGTT